MIFRPEPGRPVLLEHIDLWKPVRSGGKTRIIFKEKPMKIIGEKINGSEVAEGGATRPHQEQTSRRSRRGVLMSTPLG
jgi:hypothetical protein